MEVDPAWYEYVNGGGVFFSQFVFAFLASVVLSSKWRDYLVEARRDDFETLGRKISDEIVKIKSDPQLDSQMTPDLLNRYEDCIKKAELLCAELETSTTAAVRSCRNLCWFSFIATIFFIAVKWDTHAGVLCILFLMPLLVYRVHIAKQYSAAQERHKHLEAEFLSARNEYQKCYNKNLKDEDDKLLSFNLRRKKPHRKRK
ncbi:MAG: hypothetical protein PUD60_01490 [Akkermansia muciniphila]|nr:hypothetical protein [Akkermansia muciniphila]